MSEQNDELFTCKQWNWVTGSDWAAFEGGLGMFKTPLFLPSATQSGRF